MEILRRLLLALCTIAAISTLMEPAPALYFVDQPDFAAELRHDPFPWEHKGQTTTQYMEEETRNSIITVSKKQWQAVSNILRLQPHGYSKANTLAIKEIVDQMNPGDPTRYLKKEGAPAGELLRISKLGPGGHGFKNAPYFYQHPYAPWSLPLFITGLLLYIFLPRRRFAEDTLCYGTGFSAVIGPDLVALMIVSGFFTLGLGVGLSAAPGGLSTLFSSNLIIPTIILWAFTLFGLYMFKIAADSAGLGLQCRDGHVILYAPSGTQQISIKDVDSIKLGHWQASKWVTRFGFLISLLNWRAMGPALLNASRNDPQLELYLKDGRKFVYDLNSAQNVEPVLSYLDKSGVEIDSALKAMIPYS